MLCMPKLNVDEILMVYNPAQIVYCIDLIRQIVFCVSRVLTREMLAMQPSQEQEMSRNMSRSFIAPTGIEYLP